jgi:hypothetical protein
MRITFTGFIEAPVCATGVDYVDFPGCKLIARKRGWVHFSTGDVRCPGQEDDDTDDRGEPLIDRGRYVIGFDPVGLYVCGTVRVDS